MASLARMIGLALMVLVPGALLLLVGFVVAKAMRKGWLVQHDAAGPLRLRNALRSLRLRELWREARAVL